MKYYIAEKHRIVAQVTYLEPESFSINDSVTYATRPPIQGREVVMVTESGMGYVVKQVSVESIDGTLCVVGVATEMLKGDSGLIVEAIKDYRHENE